MTSDWDKSAEAWLTWLDHHGDWNREHIVDHAMLRCIEGRHIRSALDVGCGEGRFCRILKARNIQTAGVDPTAALIQEAVRRDTAGRYVIGRGEHLPFASASFDLVVSYLSLIAIADFRAAVHEMARVLRPGSPLVIANLTSFTSPCSDKGWIIGRNGRQLYYPLDRYLDEFPVSVSWADVRVENWHRPLRSYMNVLLDAGLELRGFDEPEPLASEPESERAALYRRVPWFIVMDWRKPNPLPHS